MAQRSKHTNTPSIWTKVSYFLLRDTYLNKNMFTCSDLVCVTLKPAVVMRQLNRPFTSWWVWAINAQHSSGQAHPLPGWATRTHPEENCSVSAVNFDRPQLIEANHKQVVITKGRSDTKASKYKLEKKMLLLLSYDVASLIIENWHFL